MTGDKTIKNKRARFFDWFVLAGLLMNVLVILSLIGIWIYH